MKGRALERWGFALLSAVLLLAASAYEPAICGSDRSSIERYIMETAGERLGDHVELLAVEDVGPDRLAVFRRETKKPDDVWIVRFQRDENGNYADYYHSIRPMLDRGGRGVYTEYLNGLGGAGQVTYLAIWNECPELAEFRFHFGEGPEQVVKVSENPSLTVVAWPEGESSMSYDFYDAQGREL